MRHKYIFVLMLILAVTACKGQPTDVSEAPSSDEEGQAPGGDGAQSSDALSQLQADVPASTIDQAWLGGFGCGVTLLDSDGHWWGFREEQGILSNDQIFDIAIDSSGEAWIASSLGIYVTDGHNWSEVGKDFSGGADAIAIDNLSGHVWAVGYKRASVFDGSSWTTFEPHNFGESEYINQVNDVAVDTQGHAWVTTGSSIATYDGTNWQFWEEGAGLAEQYFIKNIAAGQDNRIWVGHSDGILVYDGESWTDIGPGGYPQIKDVAVAPDGKVWAATYNDGAIVFNEGRWVTYDTSNSGLTSNWVRSIAFDERDRVWLGTTWGVSIFDGSNWTSYTMSTSGLAGQCIDTIAVNGNGPELPQPSTPKLGSLTGLIMAGTQPLDGVSIVLCSDQPAMIYSGAHPCADHVFFYEATTNAEGRYSINDIPIGEYQATWRAPDDEWMAYIFGGGKIIVLEGIVNEAPIIDTTAE